ncbi:MAG TPA: helicase [Desulfobacteraceae bacterium]|nr:helicase [Desulfobacteraceae bacterium]
MPAITKAFIKKAIADSNLVYSRGVSIYNHGSFFLSHKTDDNTAFTFLVDGNYGNYETRISLKNSGVDFRCNCPYPGKGCKHVVAAMLSTQDILSKATQASLPVETPQAKYLSKEQIKAQALDDRKKRAKSESFSIVRGDTFKGDHLVVSQTNREYRVTLHDPQSGKGHCNCPDFMTSGLGTCKHLIYLTGHLKKFKGFKKALARESFPFIDIYWDTDAGKPARFMEDPEGRMEDLKPQLSPYFTESGHYIPDDPQEVLALMDTLAGDKRIRFRESLLQRLDHLLQKQAVSKLSAEELPEPPLKTDLYPYQKEGVKFGLFKPGVLIGDEMGLGKTLQAITLGLLKKQVFGFSKILVVTLASLKEQWKREIEKFSDENAVVVAGTPDERKASYYTDESLFKITNYEAVLRDVLMLSRYKPDLIILDEAQRIKNFSTKAADAVKRIPKKHAIVLTGTPLENKLEDVYSIVQFLDPYKLTPLWRFAADHFMIPKKKKSSVTGYKNLDLLKTKLKDIVIRRTKEEVLKDLPDEVVNNYYIDLTEEQSEMHSGYARSLLPLLNKKYLTPLDMQRIQMLLLRMRQVCDSTFLIDRETQISPKLKELAGIIDEIVVQNKRKMVIFSEWTTMTYLIAKHLSDAGLHFIELSGKVPVKKRQPLIDEFTTNPDCRVFLSTDAGGTGLNLQAADCVVNFELPWNPAKLNQRIGRVSRIGQKSNCINVINLIAKSSIEERILAGIQLKTDLFKGVFDDGPDEVEFSREKKNEMLNRLRQMMGEEVLPDAPESAAPEEIPEDLPYYLNPEVLGKSEEAPQETAQESTASTANARDAAQETPRSDASQNIFENQSPEKIENALNSGMTFVSQLLEMATGQKMDKTEDQEKMVSIDRTTGEVTMKFKLPGF